MHLGICRLLFLSLFLSLLFSFSFLLFLSLFLSKRVCLLVSSRLFSTLASDRLLCVSPVTPTLGGQLLVRNNASLLPLDSRCLYERTDQSTLQLAFSPCKVSLSLFLCYSHVLTLAKVWLCEWRCLTQLDTFATFATFARFSSFLIFLFSPLSVSRTASSRRFQYMCPCLLLSLCAFFFFSSPASSASRINK